MNGIDILGHDNFALALQFDVIRDLYGKVDNVRVVSNIDLKSNKNKGHKFAMDSDEYQVLQASAWQPSLERSLLLGAMAGKTMRTIYEYFGEKVDLGQYEFINLIHSNAYVAKSAKLGRGIIAEPNSTISSFAELDDHVWLKRNSSIGHHTIVHGFTNINPGVTIASCCEIGSKSLIGVGAVILDKIKIGHNSVIGAGSVVTKDIPPNSVAYGVPARVVRENTWMQA